MHYAISDGKSHFVHEIIDFFKNEINLQNEEGNTPLHFSCLRGDLNTTKLLHQKGAQMSIKNEAGLMPIHLAVHHCHYYVVHYLLAIEEVVTKFESQTELYKLLKLTISTGCSQVFFLIVKVFQTKIDMITST